MPTATWLLETPGGRTTLWALERIAFVVGAVLTLWVLFMVETRFMPVITKWSLDYVHRDGDHYVLGGTLHKERACELIATSIMAVPKAALAPRSLIYQLKPDELLGGNAPVGFTTWGPWRMAIPKAFLEHRDDISFLEVVGHHRCHAGWTQQTLYGRVPLERLP